MLLVACSALALLVSSAAAFAQATDEGFKRLKGRADLWMFYQGQLGC
jgi:hypothetical protein